MATLLVEPSGALQLQVYRELNEDPDVVPDKVAQLKTWISQQPHLPNFDDYARLVSFLRGCKYDMEKTKRKLDAYFSMRTAVPELFSQRDPFSEAVARVWSEVQLIPLRDLTPGGQRVVWMNVGADKINVTSAPTLMKLSVMIGDLRLALEEVGVSGDIYVLDAARGTMEQYAKFSPSFIRKFITCMKAAYPVRLRGVHVINANPVVEYVLGVSKPLLTNKIKDRIHFHGKDLTNFSKFVPLECMPTEYGGNNGSLAETSVAWRRTIESHRQWFLDQETVRSDETRRSGGALDCDQLFGVQKNFRKLCID